MQNFTVAGEAREPLVVRVWRAPQDKYCASAAEVRLRG